MHDDKPRYVRDGYGRLVRDETPDSPSYDARPREDVASALTRLHDSDPDSFHTAMNVLLRYGCSCGSDSTDDEGTYKHPISSRQSRP
jgi:hypothetical protein